MSNSDAGHLPERRWAMVEFAIVVVRFVLCYVCVCWFLCLCVWHTRTLTSVLIRTITTVIVIAIEIEFYGHDGWHWTSYRLPFQEGTVPKQV